MRKNEHFWEYFFTHKSDYHKKFPHKGNHIPNLHYTKNFREIGVKLTPGDPDRKSPKQASQGLAISLYDIGLESSRQ